MSPVSAENMYVISLENGHIRFGIRTGRLEMEASDGMGSHAVAYPLAASQAKGLRDALDNFIRSNPDSPER